MSSPVRPRLVIGAAAGLALVCGVLLVAKNQLSNELVSGVSASLHTQQTSLLASDANDRKAEIGRLRQELSGLRRQLKDQLSSAQRDQAAQLKALATQTAGRPEAPSLSGKRVLQILDSVLAKMPLANSPYVPEAEKEKINQLANKMGGQCPPGSRLVVTGGRARGCAESVYGELPTGSVVSLLEALAIGPDDVFYDLGAGRGSPADGQV